MVSIKKPIKKNSYCTKHPKNGRTEKIENNTICVELVFTTAQTILKIVKINEKQGNYASCNVSSGIKRKALKKLVFIWH